MDKVKILTSACILIALYYLVYYIYIGFLHPLPLDGDSWDYHIPIAVTILDGSFLTTHFPSTMPQYHYPETLKPLQQIPQWYYPGSSEAINALFIFLHIPTLSNIFATLILFFTCWKLGLMFRLSKYYALLFALAFCSTNVILRWLNVVSIDVWVGVWFTLSLMLLEQPKKTIVYFAKLGFVIGMLVGTKYTAWYFLLTLVLFYFRKLLPLLNRKRTIAFLIPFSFFGLFWYIRNYISTQNPFYPLPIFGFEGELLFNYKVWDALLQHPLDMIDAGFGEYKLWLLSVPLGIIFLIYTLVKKQFQIDAITKLFLIGLINFLFFFAFPTSEQAWIMVSSFRYSFPAFIPLILGVFLLAAKYKREELVAYTVIANMINVISMAYYPKLVLIYLPFALIIFHRINKRK